MRLWRIAASQARVRCTGGPAWWTFATVEALGVAGAAEGAAAVGTLVGSARGGSSVPEQAESTALSASGAISADVLARRRDERGVTGLESPRRHEPRPLAGAGQRQSAGRPVGRAAPGADPPDPHASAD